MPCLLQLDCLYYYKSCLDQTWIETVDGALIPPILTIRVNMTLMAIQTSKQCCVTYVQCLIEIQLIEINQYL